MNYFQLLQAIACLCTIASFAGNLFGFTAKDINKPNGYDRVQAEIATKR